MGILKNQHVGMAVLISAIVFGLYFNTLFNTATNWDDPALFTRESLHGMTMENLKQVLSIQSFSTYQPVRDITYMVDFTLWGPSRAAVIFGMHIQSMILYLLMILACWRFLLELFRVFVDDEDLAFTWAAFSTIIYAAHPVHVESVAWLYARKEPLLGLFTFLCMWMFIRARVSSWRYYISSGIFLVLAILSKPTALVIPAVLILLDLAIQGRLKQPSFWRWRAFVYAPMLVLVIPMAVRLVEMMIQAGGVKPYHGGSFWTNLLAVSHILVSYIDLIGFTINFSADYPIRLHADPHAWQAWVFVGINIILILAAVAAFVKRHYLAAFFIAWYYIFLLPVSHIFPIAQIMADRYALLPSLSWCVLLGYGLSLLRHLDLKSPRFSPEFPMVLSMVFSTVIVLSYGYMTIHQNTVWRNSQTLWEDTLAKYPNSSPGNVNLAAIYLSQMRFREVQDLCLAAIREKPYDYLAISNLALAQMMMGQFDNAINNYQQALKLKPDLMTSRKGLANAYWLNGDYDDAYRLYTGLFREGRIGPGDGIIGYYYRTGLAAWKLGRKEEGERFLDEAMKNSDQDPSFLENIALAYTSMGDLPKARTAFAELLPRIRNEDSRKKLAYVIELLDRKIRGSR